MNLAIFIIALVLIVIGLTCIAFCQAAEEPGIPVLVGVVLIVIGGFTVFMDSFHVVPTRTVAMETSYGKPKATLQSGWHWMAPWASVEEFPATVETMKLSGDKDDNGDPIVVRLSNAATATVDVTVQWQIDPKGDITPLYNDYRTFDNIGNNVVRRELSAALATAFGDYDPLASLKGEKTKVTPADLAEDVRVALVAKLPSNILVRSVLLPKIVFDDNIQGKINQYLAAIAETQIAEQRQKTAEAQKKANDLLAAGGNTSPGVLYQNCLDMVASLARDGKPLPPAFNCGAPPTTTVPVGAK